MNLAEHAGPRLAGAWRFLALVLLVMIVGAGCAQDGSSGYTTGQGLYRQDIKTVAVPIWRRSDKVYRRELETRLSEALIKRIELDTPWKVTDKSKADTILEGTIVAVTQRVLSFNPREGEPRDAQLRILVNFTWKDLRTGEILANEKRFRDSDVYHVAEPFDEDFFTGANGAVNRLALGIVRRMEEPW